VSRGDRGQRTQAERERDRLERERRREGAATPDPQPPARPEDPPHKKEQLTSLAELQAELRATVPQAPLPPRKRPRVSRVAGLVALIALGLAVALLAASQLHGKHTPKVIVPKEVRVLVPEGETGAQIAEIAKRAGLHGSYTDATKTSKLLDPTHYGAPKGTRSLEGFLFPATYDMDEGEPAANLVGKQLIAFGENFGSEEAHRARELHVTPYDLLIVASMIEREAQTPGDRPKIAAVIYNRLRAGIPLGIDATIYYAVEQAKGIATYTHELTESQLHIDSPYNTRLHKGLPPTPISNPGMASIHAAAHPAHVGYLYYVAGADGCGEQVFSDTETEFEADVSAYREAVAKNGGRPPTCKHKG
jgi:cell division protein YceG involved in septum cleavage